MDCPRSMLTCRNGSSCILEVVVEPPRAVQPGQTLHPPLVVGLRTGKSMGTDVQPWVDGVPEDEAHPDRPARLAAHPEPKQDDSALESGALWAFVHLIPGTSEATEGSASKAPCRTTGLSGTLIDSPHRAVDQQPETGMQYLKFQNLAINDAGTFSLRVALCRMSSNSGHSTSGIGVATTIDCVSTRDIAVHPSAPRYPLGE